MGLDASHGAGSIDPQRSEFETQPTGALKQPAVSTVPEGVRRAAADVSTLVGLSPQVHPEPSKPEGPLDIQSYSDWFNSTHSSSGVVDKMPNSDSSPKTLIDCKQVCLNRIAIFEEKHVLFNITDVAIDANTLQSVVKKYQGTESGKAVIKKLIEVISKDSSYDGDRTIFPAKNEFLEMLNHLINLPVPKPVMQTPPQQTTKLTYQLLAEMEDSLASDKNDSNYPPVEGEFDSLEGDNKSVPQGDRAKLKKEVKSLSVEDQLQVLPSASPVTSAETQPLPQSETAPKTETLNPLKTSGNDAILKSAQRGDVQNQAKNYLTIIIDRFSGLEEAQDTKSEVSKLILDLKKAFLKPTITTSDVSSLMQFASVNTLPTLAAMRAFDQLIALPLPQTSTFLLSNFETIENPTRKDYDQFFKAFADAVTQEFKGFSKPSEEQRDLISRALSLSNFEIMDSNNPDLPRLGELFQAHSDPKSFEEQVKSMMTSEPQEKMEGGALTRSASERVAPKATPATGLRRAETTTAASKQKPTIPVPPVPKTSTTRGAAKVEPRVPERHEKVSASLSNLFKQFTNPALKREGVDVLLALLSGVPDNVQQVLDRINHGTLDPKIKGPIVENLKDLRLKDNLSLISSVINPDDLFKFCLTLGGSNRPLNVQERSLVQMAISVLGVDPLNKADKIPALNKLLQTGSVSKVSTQKTAIPQPVNQATQGRIDGLAAKFYSLARKLGSSSLFLNPKVVAQFRTPGFNRELILKALNNFGSDRKILLQMLGVVDEIDYLSQKNSRPTDQVVTHHFMMGDVVFTNEVVMKEKDGFSIGEQDFSAVLMRREEGRTEMSSVKGLHTHVTRHSQVDTEEKMKQLVQYQIDRNPKAIKGDTINIVQIVHVGSTQEPDANARRISDQMKTYTDANGKTYQVNAVYVEFLAPGYITRSDAEKLEKLVVRTPGQYNVDYLKGVFSSPHIAVSASSQEESTGTDTLVNQIIGAKIKHPKIRAKIEGKLSSDKSVQAKLTATIKATQITSASKPRWQFWTRKTEGVAAPILRNPMLSTGNQPRAAVISRAA